MFSNYMIFVSALVFLFACINYFVLFSVLIKGLRLPIVLAFVFALATASHQISIYLGSFTDLNFSLIWLKITTFLNNINYFLTPISILIIIVNSCCILFKLSKDHTKKAQALGRLYHASQSHYSSYAFNHQNNMYEHYLKLANHQNSTDKENSLGHIDRAELEHQAFIKIKEQAQKLFGKEHVTLAESTKTEQETYEIVIPANNINDVLDIHKVEDRETLTNSNLSILDQGLCPQNLQEKSADANANKEVFLDKEEIELTEEEELVRFETLRIKAARLPLTHRILVRKTKPIKKLKQNAVFFFKVCRTTFICIAFVCAIISTFNVLQMPSVNRIELKLDIPATFDGLRFIQISDLNTCELYPRERNIDIVMKIFQLKPDMIFITGDIITGAPKYIHQELLPILRLKAPLGVYFVPGNGDYEHHYLQLKEIFAQYPIQFLENKVISIPYLNKQLTIIGLADEMAQRYGYDGPALKYMTLPSNSDFTILLAHEPRNAKKYFEDSKEKIDLMLSGHTLGGLTSGLKDSVAKANNGFLEGFYKIANKMVLYVSPGTNSSALLPIRFGSRPEISLYEIRSTQLEK